jgi:hypothetical protein
MLSVQLPRFAQDILIQLRRHENARKTRSERSCRFQRPQTVKPGHMDVEQRQMDVASLDHIQRLNPVRGETSTVASASQSLVKRVPKGNIIVGNQYSMIRYVHGILRMG